MTKLPIVSAKQVIKVLSKFGYEYDHQKGSHVILRKRVAPHRRISIPNYEELPRGTLRAILEEAGLTDEQFLKLL
jgi:predicted RNA binding protein YcfA (HicA-like mRNA interferase family)